MISWSQLLSHSVFQSVSQKLVVGYKHLLKTVLGSEVYVKPAYKCVTS